MPLKHARVNRKSGTPTTPQRTAFNPRGGTLKTVVSSTSTQLLNRSRSLHENLQLSARSSTKKYETEDLVFLRTIGTGTFGRVQLCYHPETKEYFALKILKKSKVAKLQQIQHVKAEKSILARVRHPFIVNLVHSYQNEENLYMLQEFVNGGELFAHLRRAQRFPVETARFYAAAIVLALEYLHSMKIVYRDLKPENLLLDKQGHMKICDFGFAKVVEEHTYTLCGTVEYLAPEIILNKGHQKAVDWWALGILIFEMLAGYPPFYDENPFVVSEKILTDKVYWPRHMDPTSRDLIKRLLARDPSKRFGNLRGGAEDIKRHRFFRDIDWNALYHRRIEAPIKPNVNADGDDSQYDQYPDSDEEDEFTDYDKAVFDDF
eukprot:TRINITY_DN2978_c1_g1_i2.p1 TRINITY_DN2978_c1_g1~~TRINITY_DN2978_c1_g1_i2.p1  ORF type:complete len:376 (-),score=99.91 TRINITY_DN2978_c1_g1_i2:293-1420(-)